VLRPLFESVFSALCGVLAVVTVVWPTWIETTIGVEPDGGSGALEWLVIVVLGVVGVAFGLLARRHFRLARPLVVHSAATDARSK
jgi:hypothetical protein